MEGHVMKRSAFLFLVFLSISLLLFSILLLPFPSGAQQRLENLLVDHNGDGIVTLAAFGDSITVGKGDEEDKGYPGRLSEILNLEVINGGLSGEEFCKEGILRFPRVLGRSDPDLILILEGFNDARVPQSDAIYQRLMQRAINVTLARGREPVLMTLMRPDGNHIFLAPYTPGYSSVLRSLASMNSVPYVDLGHVWKTTCVDRGACELFNQPDGLHPNATGYTAIAQAISARLLGIDIFSATGASELEQAAGLPAGSVIVKPDTAKKEGA